MARCFPFIVLALAAFPALAQYTPPDPSGLEGIIVETYYIANADDAGDTDGSTQLVAGAVTYRVFVDLKEGYKLLTVGGFTDHPITFHTTTTFFNNDDRGEAWGADINDSYLDQNTVALDSWLSAGGASDAHWGIPKVDDPDGSIVGGSNNDGGSNSVPGGLLVNDAAAIGLPLTTSDGLWVSGTPPGTTSVGVAPEIVNTGGNDYASDNFAWAVLGGVQTPDAANKILIGQFTTDGTFSFCLNLWVRIPDDLVCNDPNCHQILEFYGNLLPSDTAGAGFNTDNKFTLPSLCFTSSAQPVDCEGVAGGTALPGSSCDDGIADTNNDVYDADCLCVGEDCLGVLGGNALPGQPCDDNDPNTANDLWQTGCVCTGTVGMEEMDARQAVVSIFPNPVREHLHVDLVHMTGEHVMIDCRNVLGERVAGQDLGNTFGSSRNELDMSAMRAGVYFVRVTYGTQERTERITKF